MTNSSISESELKRAHAWAFSIDWPFDPVLLTYQNPSKRGLPKTEWKWIEIFWSNRQDIKRIYRGKIEEFYKEIAEIQKHTREANQTITDWNERWVLEVIIEQNNAEIKKIEGQIRHLEFIIKRINQPKIVQTVLDVDQAKAVPLEQIFDGPLRAMSGKLVGICPFHDEGTPSFTIFKDNHYYCFGCNEKGDSIDYIQKTKNLDFKDAVKFLMGL